MMRQLLVLTFCVILAGCNSSSTAVMPEKTTPKPGAGGLKAQGGGSPSTTQGASTPASGPSAAPAQQKKPGASAKQAPPVTLD